MIGLGFIRFVLATMVLLNHLWLPTANVLGAHAVTGFYIISGFLMTKIVNEVYVGKGWQGRYLKNRILRIYPAYLLVLSISLFCIAIWPNYFKVYSLIYFPSNINEWVSNLTLWRLTESPAIVIPPAWSLYVEAFYYLLIMVIGRFWRIVLLWLMLSMVYTVWMCAMTYSFGERYHSLGAASLFFSTGAILFFLTKEECLNFYMRLPTSIIYGAFVLFIFFPLLIGDIGGGKYWLGYYGASALFSALFAALIVKKGLKGGRFDRFMGNLAYPVFLTHFLAVGLVNLLTDNRFAISGNANFILSTFACLFMSFIYLGLMEPFIDKLRNQVRASVAKVI